MLDWSTTDSSRVSFTDPDLLWAQWVEPTKWTNLLTCLDVGEKPSVYTKEKLQVKVIINEN